MGRCANIKRHKLDVEQVGRNTECGILLQGFHDVRPGDVLQCYRTDLVTAPAMGQESASASA